MDAGPGDDASVVDAGYDAGYTPPVDAGSDAGYDAGPVAPVDAGYDAGYDGGYTPPFDAGPQDTPTTLSFPSTATPPTIDGTVDAQWSGADECDYSFGNERARCFGMADATNVYIACTIDDVTEEGNDKLEISFDVDRNGGDPDTPDRTFIAKRDFAFSYSGGTGSNGDGLAFGEIVSSTAVGVIASSPASWGLELSIPRSELGATGSGSPLRYRASWKGKSGSGDGVCPPGSLGLDTSTWGQSPLP
jgi:hypothetical protein